VNERDESVIKVLRLIASSMPDFLDVHHSRVSLYSKELEKNYVTSNAILSAWSVEMNHFAQRCVELIQSRTIKEMLLEPYLSGCCVEIYRKLLQLKQETILVGDEVMVDAAIDFLYAESHFRDVMEAHENIEIIMKIIHSFDHRFIYTHCIKKEKNGRSIIGKRTYDDYLCLDERVSHFMHCDLDAIYQMTCACQCTFTCRYSHDA
jgi:hypothetical protein